MTVATIKDGVLLNAKGRPINLSPSSYDTWTACERSWFYSYVMRLESPPKPSALIGTRVHAHLERWVRDGLEPEPKEAEVFDPVKRRFVKRLVDQTQTNEWKMAQALMPYLPEVTPGVGVVGNWRTEVKLDGVPCGDLPFKGFVDLSNTEDFDRWKIDDYKTTSSTSFRWSKVTREQLMQAPQPLAYAYAFWLKHGGPKPEAVDLRHFNVATSTIRQPDGSYTYPVHVTNAEAVPWDIVEENWERMADAAGAQRAVALRAATAEDVNFNTDACRNYGGCPHAGYCPASPTNRENEDMGNTSSRAAALRQQVSKVNNPTETAPADSPALDPKVQATVDRIRTQVAKTGSLPLNSVKAVARTAGVDLDVFLAAVPLTVDGDKVVLATATAEAPKPTKGALDDLIEFIRKGDGLEDDLMMVAAGIPSDNKALVKAKLVDDEGNLTTKGVSVCEAMGIAVVLEDVDEPEEEEVEPEPEEEAPAPAAKAPAAKAPAAKAPPAGTYDADLTAVPALLEALAASDGTLPRAEASRIIIANSDSQRVRAQLLTRYAKALGGEYDERGQVLTGPTGPSNAEVAEAETASDYEMLLGLSADDAFAAISDRGVALGYVLSQAGLKEYKGLVVPADFSGNIAQAHKLYSRDSAKRRAAEVIAKDLEGVDKTDAEREEAAKPAPAPRTAKASTAPEPEPPAAPEPEPPAAPEPDGTPPSVVGVLYVDCLPVGRQVTPLDQVLHKFEAEVEQEGGKSGGRQVTSVDHYLLYDYAEGKSRVLAKFASYLRTEGLASGGYSLSSGHPLCDGVVNLLVARTDFLVVKAAR